MQLMKMSEAAISEKGPPGAVSAMSHFKMEDAAATERADDDDARRPRGVEGNRTRERVLDRFLQVGLGRVIRGNDGGKRSLWVGHLVRPGQKRNRRARKASMVSKRSDAPPRRIGQELNVIQNPASAGEARKVSRPNSPGPCSNGRIGYGHVRGELFKK